MILTIGSNWHWFSVWSRIMKYFVLFTATLVYFYLSVMFFHDCGGVVPVAVAATETHLIDIETGAAYSINQVINWFAGIVSSILVFVIIAMLKHMWNTERHLDAKKTQQIEDHIESKKGHVPEDFSPKEYVTISSCNKTHNEILHKIEESNGRFLKEVERIKEEMLKEMKQACSQNEKALTYTRKITAMLLKQAGVKDTSVLEKPE